MNINIQALKNKSVWESHYKFTWYPEKKYNFFDEIFDTNEKLETVNKWTKKFKSRSPLASQMIKRSMNVLAYNHAIAIMHMDYDQFLLTQNYSDS